MKLFLCTLSLVFLTAILNLVIGIYASYKGLTQNVESDLKSIGQSVENSIDTSLNNIKVSIQSVAQSDLIGKAGVTQAETLQMLDMQKKQLGYQSLSLVNKNGTIISSDANLNGKNIAGQEYFKQALSGKTYISTPTYDINNKFCTIVCTPVSNNNHYQGIIMATYDSQVYSNMIKNIVIGKTGNVFLVDHSGVIISTVRAQNVIKRQSVVPVVYKMMEAGKSGIVTYAYDTGDRICYCAPIKNSDGWEYCVVAPIAEMTSSIWVTAIALICSSIVCIILGLLCSRAISRSIANPIALVCNRLKLLASGDLHTDAVEVKAQDETGVLAASLNKTLMSLRHYIAEITQVLHEVSKGDMLVKTDVEFEGDFIPIKASLEGIINNLNHIFTEIRIAADQVSGGAEQISNAAQSLSQGATEQASSIEELSASITEINTKIDNSAKSASEANRLSSEAAKEMEVGRGQMEKMVEAMGGINDASEK